jgi:hypothetical protein
MGTRILCRMTMIGGPQEVSDIIWCISYRFEIFPLEHS